MALGVKVLRVMADNLNLSYPQDMHNRKWTPENCPLSPHIIYDMCMCAHTMNKLNNLKVLDIAPFIDIASYFIYQEEEAFEVKNSNLFNDSDQPYQHPSKLFLGRWAKIKCNSLKWWDSMWIVIIPITTLVLKDWQAFFWFLKVKTLRLRETQSAVSNHPSVKRKGQSKCPLLSVSSQSSEGSQTLDSHRCCKRPKCKKLP